MQYPCSDFCLMALVFTRHIVRKQLNTMFKKIAVLRANAIGDFVFTLPALQSLRVAFPDAEIVLLGKEMHKRLLANRKSPIDRVVVIPPYPGVGYPADGPADHTILDSFFAAMRSENFDVAIQMHGGGKYSNRFVNSLGASFTIGSKTQDAEDLDQSIPYTTYFNETVRYLEIVSLINVLPVSIAPELQVTREDLHAAEQAIPKWRERPLVVIQPGATDPRRWWPAHKFAVVAGELINKGYQVCFNGVEQERHLIDNIISSMRGTRAKNLAGELSLSALIGLLSKADLLISNDTGPLHLAHALKTPAVGIYWAPNMITGSPMGCRWAKPLVAWNTTCPKCGAGFRDMKDSNCTHDVSFVEEISVEDVLGAATELLHNHKQESVENQKIVR
jgi:ADP-heptose:LPS heptosyltransferase